MPDHSKYQLRSKVGGEFCEFASGVKLLIFPWLVVVWCLYNR